MLLTKRCERVRTAWPLLLLQAAFVSFPAFAGPITPPPGPVASTHKTLTEVEPRIAINATNTPGDADSVYRISQPGSYYLTGHVTAAPGERCIEIGASNVTIDLNGFTVIGVGSSIAGIGVDLAHNGLTVRNGVVENCPGRGVDLCDVWSSFGHVVENVTVRSCGIGILVGSDAVIKQCISTNNEAEGIVAGNDSVVTACAANENGSLGIVAGDGSTVSHCSGGLNAGTGILVGTGSTVEGCASRSNLGHGIQGGSGSLVASCTASANGLTGVFMLSDSTVTGCTVYRNTSDGIAVNSDCEVRNNNCNENGFGAGSGAGIVASGSDIRVEGNHCSDNDWGIRALFAGNIIVRNTCSGNTTANWDLVANNVFGPIVNRSAPGSAAVLGDSASSSLGSTDPNANFTY
jgi:parallel beta-helix repeat protein